MYINLIGQRFGRLTVVKYAGQAAGRRSKWLCICKCGKKVEILRQSLVSKLSKSCGCLHKERSAENARKLFSTHGFSRTRFYIIWTGMVARCANPIKGYGTSGINVCNRWLKFENFKFDMYSNYLIHIELFGEKNTSIDRINVYGNYSKENCRWTTAKKQARNKRENFLVTYHGKTQTLAEWAEELKINYKTLWSRIGQRKWSIERTFSQPYRLL